MVKKLLTAGIDPNTKDEWLKPDNIGNRNEDFDKFQEYLESHYYECQARYAEDAHNPDLVGVYHDKA